MFYSLLTCVQLKDLGSLSVVMLVMQCGGALLTAYNLASVGGVELFLPYIFASFFQGTLICLGIYYW
jgi:hypothetical protein